jgi:hypothetical protein
LLRCRANLEWICACGQSYGVSVIDDRLRLWPQTGNYAYSRRGLGVGSCCILCGQPLAAADALDAEAQ